MYEAGRGLVPRRARQDTVPHVLVGAMTAPAELVDWLDGRVGRAGFAIFAAACATRLTPVFESFARTGKGRYTDWLAQLWVCIGAPDPALSRELEQQIKAAPEAAVDDSHRPGYYAMRALGVLFYAVQVLAADDMAAAALRCSRAAGSLLRDLDYVWAHRRDLPEPLPDWSCVPSENGWTSSGCPLESRSAGRHWTKPGLRASISGYNT
jgi:hypothetical protein